MSKAFHRVFIPPAADWRQWIDTIDPSRARELAQTIALLDRRVKKLPRDVWNMIIGLVYHGTVHCVHDGGITLVNWLEYWVTHPEQQRGVPLLIAPGTDEIEHSDFSGMRALEGRHHVTNQQIPNHVPPDCVVQYYKPRWKFTGEHMFRGTWGPPIVNDPEVLRSLSIGVNPIAPFSPNCRAQIQTADGKWVTFYYNPEIPVLPVLEMYYQRATLEWHRTDVAPPPITIVYVMHQNYLMRAQSVLTLCNHIVKDRVLQNS
jgi:hypothetical protein